MIKFSRHAVAYLDILGFEDFVTNSENSEDDLEKLNDLITNVIPYQVNIEGFPSDHDVKCLSISDSIVITAPVNNNLNYHALTAVSIKAIQIAHALLNIGLLVRGGLTIGNVYRTEKNIVGTGYQEAVKLEKQADYPQIILSESAENVLKELAKKSKIFRFAIYSKNKFGKIILNSIYPEELYFSDPSEEINTRFKRYRETISEKLYLEDSKALAKWIWFAGLYNANVNYFSCITDKSLLIESELPTLTMNCLNSIENGFFDAFKQEPVILSFNTP